MTSHHESRPDSPDIAPGIIYPPSYWAADSLPLRRLEDAWSEPLDAGRWSFTVPASFGMIFDSPTTVLITQQSGEVDLCGNTPEHAARAWWRATLRQPEDCIQPEADGAAVVLIAGKRAIVLFPDGTFDGLDDVRPEGRSREFWSHVARMYSSLPPWLFERSR